MPLTDVWTIVDLLGAHKEPSHQRKPSWDDYPRQVRARLAEELCNFSEGMVEIVGSVEILYDTLWWTNIAIENGHV